MQRYCERAILADMAAPDARLGKYEMGKVERA